jgi:hypothetical protein
MSCDWVRSALSLFLYGELSFEEEEAVHGHLATCESCRKALERAEALHVALDRAEMAPPAGLLAECRSKLRDSVSAASTRHSWLGRLWDWTGQSVPVAFLRPAAALALVALGFFSARLVPQGTARVPVEKSPVSTQVRYLQPNSTGGVRIVVDETRERVLSGNWGEAPIQRLVLEAAQDPSDPALRLDSMDILGMQSNSPAVRNALLNAVRSDSNAGVRLKAIEGLKPFGGDPQVRSVLAQVLLADDNVGVRAQAIDLLVQHKGMALVGVLQELMEREQDGYIRQRCQQALEEMNASTSAF